MATTYPATEAVTTGGTYTLAGTILEACTCHILCPCWVGEDPDEGTCSAILAYHVETGQVRGVDVSGLTLLMAAHIPGNVFHGGMKRVLFVDEAATPEQFQALLDVFQGRLGGPVAELVDVLMANGGEELAAYQVPVRYDLVEGQGSVSVEGKVQATVQPYRSMYGEVTTLRDSVFSTIPGSPAWVAKADALAVTIPEHGLSFAVAGRNAIQGQFRFEA